MYCLVLLSLLFFAGSQATKVVPDYVVPVGSNLEIQVTECNTWEWYHNDVQLEVVRSALSRHAVGKMIKLRIDNVTPEDAGTYRCGDNVKLVAVYHPRQGPVIVDSENQEIGENLAQVDGTARLSCLFSYYDVNNPPHLRIQWEDGTGKIVNAEYSHTWVSGQERYYKNMINRLTVHNVDESTNQIYTCRPAYYNELTGLYVPMSEPSQTVVIGGGHMHMGLHSGSNNVIAAMNLVVIALAFLIVW